MESTKQCRTCGETKPLSDFYRTPGARDGHRNDCKACNLAYKRERYAADPDKYKAMVKRWQQANAAELNEYRRLRRTRESVKRQERNTYYLRTYGISADEVDAMLAAQGGGCAICGVKPDRLASLHLDHDHDTGHLRGILCVDCNHGLGKFRDDPELLVAATEYLRRTRRPSLSRSVASLAAV